MRTLSLILISLLFTIDLVAQKEFKRRTTLPNAVNEVSGLVVVNEDSILMINDSGDKAQLYTLNSKGQLLNKQLINGIENKDWEALASDKEDLFIADFGNNCNCRQDLVIYRLHNNEVIDSIFFDLPDQKNFNPQKAWMNYDLEALAYSNNTLHLFSKNKVQKGNYYSKHYTLDLLQDEPKAVLQDSILLPKLVVTGASFSPDGSECLIVAYNYKMLFGFIPYSSTRLFRFSNYEAGAVYSGTRTPYRIGPLFFLGQYESVDWIDAETALIASERTAFIGPRMKKIKLKRKKTP